jgi:hypothetical protein
VHHLFDPGQAAQCLGFFSSQHVPGVSAETWDFAALTPAAEQSPLPHIGVFTLTRFSRSDQPRAPPALPARPV